MATASTPLRTRRTAVWTLGGALLGGILVLLVVLVGNAVVVARAEATIEERLGAELGAPVEATVIGRLAGIAVLRGRIARLDLVATGVPLDRGGPRTTIDLLDVELHDLRIDGQVPVAGTGTFVAAFTQAQVRANVPDVVQGLIGLEDDTAVLGSGALSVPLELSVADQQLLVAPDLDAPVLDGAVDGLLGGLLGGILDEVVPQAFEVPLDPPAGVQVEGVAVREGRLLLTGTLDPVVVAAG